MGQFGKRGSPLQLAKLIVDIATGEVNDRVDDGKSAAGVVLIGAFVAVASFFLGAQGDATMRAIKALAR